MRGARHVRFGALRRAGPDRAVPHRRRRHRPDGPRHPADPGRHRGAPCGRDAKCGVVVAAEHASVPGAVVPITFAAGPGADYDFARLASGLCGALVLLGIAWFLVRTTDWRKPTEADTPDLDAATAG